MTKLSAYSLIAFIAAITSTNFILMKFGVADGGAPPITFTSLRFVFGSAALIAYYNRSLLSISSSCIVDAGRSGAFFAFGAACLCISLLTVPSAQAGFLINGCAIMVPVFSYFLIKERLNWQVVLGVVVAFVGMSLLSYEDDFSIVPGVKWSILGAALFSFWSISMSHYAPKHNTVHFAVAQVAFAGVLLVVAAFLLEQPSWNYPTRVWLSALAIGLFSTGLRFVLQTKAQVYVSATITELIFLIEPLLAAAWGALFLGEILSTRQYVGGLLIVVGVALGAFYHGIKSPVDAG